MARTYRRDSNGRFSGGGGSSGPSRKGVRQAPKGASRTAGASGLKKPPPPPWSAAMLAARKTPKAQFDRSAWERRVKRSTAVGARPIAAQGTKVTAKQAKKLRKSFETSARAAAFYRSVAEGAASGRYGKGAGAMRASLAARPKKSTAPKRRRRS